MAERPFPTIRLPADGEIDAFTFVHPTGVEFRHPEAESAIECFAITPVHHTRPRQGNDQTAANDGRPDLRVWPPERVSGVFFLPPYRSQTTSVDRMAGHGCGRRQA